MPGSVCSGARSACRHHGNQTSISSILWFRMAVLIAKLEPGLQNSLCDFVFKFPVLAEYIIIPCLMPRERIVPGPAVASGTHCKQLRDPFIRATEQKKTQTYRDPQRKLVGARKKPRTLNITCVVMCGRERGVAILNEKCFNSISISQKRP
jgi:hypothetical protein